MKIRNDREKRKLIQSAAIFLSFGAVMYFKNRLIPKYADDYPYSFIWEGDKNGNLAFGKREYRRVRNLRDLLKSQISHYKTWDGRAIAESLVQLFLIKDDKKYFDRANTAVMLLQLMLISALGKGKKGLKNITPSEALLLTGGFFVSAPHLIATCFWLTGSMNYLWMGILQSAHVLPYAMHYHGRIGKFPRSLSFLSGILSGWSTETGAGAALMLSGMETVRALMKKEYSSWMGWGLAGEILGMLLLLLAPGNKVKLRIENECSDTLPKTMEESLPGYIPLDYLYTREMFKKWFKEGFMVTILRELPLQIPVALYFLQKKDRVTEDDIYILGLEAVSLAVPSVMMFSPEYPRRATYPSVIYLLAASLCALSHLNLPGYGELSPGMRTAVISAVAVYIVNVLSSLIVDSDLSYQIDRQIDHIKANKDREMIFVDDVFIPPVYSFLAGDRSINWDVVMGVCLDNADDPYNEAAAAYYGSGKIYTDSDTDHIYEKKDFKSRLYGIINPLKSFALKTREIIFGAGDRNKEENEIQKET